VSDMITTPTDRRPTFEEMFEEVLAFSKGDPEYGALTHALGVSPAEQAEALEREKEALRLIYLEDLALEIAEATKKLGKLLQAYLSSFWPISLFWRGYMYLAEIELADIYSFVSTAIYEAKMSGHEEDEFRLVNDALEEARRADNDYGRVVGWD
jgi:hypothetical protein